LSYIGRSSFVSLTGFDDDDIKKLLENRLRLVNADFNKVIGPGVPSRLRQLSAGNPRAALDACSIAYQQAIADNLPQLTVELIDSCFGHDLRRRSQSIVLDLSKAGEDVREALRLLYSYGTAVERVGVAPEAAWDAMAKFLTEGKLPLQVVPERLRPFLPGLADMHTGLLTGGMVGTEWVLHRRSKVLLREIRRLGLSPKSFLDQFRLNPILPGGSTSEATLRTVMQESQDQLVQIHLQRAARSFERMKEGGFPVRTILAARYGIEHLLVAYLTHLRVSLPPDYVDSPEDGMMVDAFGRMKTKYASRLIRELTVLVNSLMGHRGEFIRSLPEIRLIQGKAVAALHSDSASQLGTGDADIVVKAVGTVESEFSKLLRPKEAPATKGNGTKRA